MLPFSIRQLRQLLVPLGVVLCVELLRWLLVLPFTGAAALYLLAVTYSAYRQGVSTGLVAAALTMLHALYMLRAPGQWLNLSVENELRLGLHGLTTGAVLVIIYLLQTRNRQFMVESNRRQEQQSQMLDAVSEAILTYDAGGAITLCNRPAEALFGYSRSEALQLNLADLLPPGRQSGDLPVPGGRGEAVAIRKDGRLVPVALAISEVPVDGRRCFMAILRDNQAVKQREQELGRLSRQHELILNSAGEGIIGLDAWGMVTFMNPAGARMLGWNVTDLIGRDIHELVHHCRPDGTPYSREESPLCLALRDGMYRSGADDLFSRRGGARFYAEYTSTPIREGHVLTGAVVTLRDVTEQRALDRMKDEFIAVVSHELRTPLTSVRGALGLMASGLLGNLNEDAREMMTIALRNSDRLARLINDILDMGKLDAGRDVTIRQVCDAADLMRQAMESVEGAAAAARIDLQVELLAAPVWADNNRIIQTLTNLLSNAIKFSPPGSTVRLSARREDHQIQFSVADQGRGIPPEKLEKIFDRFYQADSPDTRDHGGTGIGLALCRSIIQRHAGRIWAESKPGAGSTFHFTLPVMQGGEEAASAARVHTETAR